MIVDRMVASAGAISLFSLGVQAVMLGVRALGIAHWPWVVVLLPAELILLSLALIGAVIITMVASDNRAKARR